MKEKTVWPASVWKAANEAKENGTLKRNKESVMKIVYGISDWPEEMGKEFEILAVREGETDEEAIARARALYNPDLQCVIR